MATYSSISVLHWGFNLFFYFTCSSSYDASTTLIHFQQGVIETCSFRAIIVRLFTHAENSIHHEKHSCQNRGCEKTPEDVPKIPFPTEKQNGFPNRIELDEAFWFKTASSILVMAPSVVARLVLPNHYSWIV